MKHLRLRFVMWVARQLGVPVDVHPSYFAGVKGKSGYRPLACKPDEREA